MLLSNKQITEEIKNEKEKKRNEIKRINKKIKICIERYDDENKTTQNLWGLVKPVLIGS